MDHRMTALERAFQLASPGKFQDSRKSLRRLAGKDIPEIISKVPL
jgi:hypothetical protein